MKMVSPRTATIIACIPAFIYLTFKFKNYVRQKKMSSTTLIACISSALHDSELLVDSQDRKEVIAFLRHLKMFVLCSKQLSDDPSLEHFLVQIEESLRELSPTSRRFCIPNDSSLVERYLQFSRSLKGEVDKWFVTMFSKQLLGDDASLAVKNFLDFIMSTLADFIWLNKGHVSFYAESIESLMKDQLKELYQKLTSLRIIVNKHPLTNLDMEIQKEIVDVVTDAGISICSIYQPQVDVNFGLQNLLDKFKTVLSKISETDPHILIFNSPRTSFYGFVDCILEKLMELASSERESTAKTHAQIIQEELDYLRSHLGRVVELSDIHGEFQTLWERLLEVALKVESAIDYLAIDPLLDSFSASFDSVIEDIGRLKVDVLKIEVKGGQYGVTNHHNHLPSQTTPPNHEVIGFQDEEREVLDRLRGGSQHLRIVAIVGMPGLGKTTLANKVYNHPLLSHHFSAKAWCTISQVLDKKNVLSHLMKQICPATCSEMNEHDLADNLRRSLKGKRYLIFLDDIWNSEAWDSLKGSFPDDTKGSRIIFTSRSLDVAPSEMLDQKPLILSPLSEKDSLNLMCSKLFPGKGNDLPPSLHDLGMQIVAMCGGLPLAIITVAGVLANTEAKAWEGILRSFSFLSSEGNCRFTWEFSYVHLPAHLRPCFLYFGMFPEDREVPVRRLLRMWIAEGFIRKSETSSLEDVAEDYLNMLIGRSLIMAAKRRSDGGVKTCLIHDLLRDFCLEKAKDEDFFLSTIGGDDLNSLNEPQNLRRIHTDYKSLRRSNLYLPHTRSLLLRSFPKLNPGVYLRVSPILYLFKLLKVLDLEEISIGPEFPCAIQQFVLLAFLSIKGEKFTIPSWLPDLSNLETLIIHIERGGPNVALPENLWNLQRLKYLYIKNGGYRDDGGCGVLPVVNLDDSSVLYELQRFRGAIIDWCSIEKQLSKFPNIRKLKCLLVGDADEGEYVFPEFSSKLESLDIHGQRSGLIVGFEFTALKNLYSLKLSNLCFDWEIFSVIGNQLPSLQVLKLRNLSLGYDKENTWEMKEGEFSKLRILYMSHLPIKRWIACDDHEFECFQKLVLLGCNELIELPSCLETIETLEAIEIGECSKETEDLVTEIEVAQKDWGNSGLKITREVPVGLCYFN